MYTLYFWNPWDFGHWIKKESSDKIADLEKIVKDRRTLTYKITKNDKIVKYKEAAGCYWRLGMVSPNSTKIKKEMGI